MDLETLNENQGRHFLSSCRYVDRLLSDMEAILASGESGSPFNRFVQDGTPADRRVITDYIARIRREIVKALASEGIHPPAPAVSVSHALRTHLSFIDVAVEELKPGYMRGYGALADAAADRLSGLMAELQATIAKLDLHLARGAANLDRRMERLETAGRDITAIRLLKDVIERQGLTEFHPALDLLLERMEQRHFEIAVFGRVSTGKSSLLNHLLHTDVLPVGVNPITAIPTRLLYGDPARITVDFLGGKQETYPIEDLPAFVSEERNPGNARRVSRLVVHVPAERLADGILFVDTPGLGSLAASGAAETLAYLPRCDLGFVLIDASSTLTPEDVGTVRALLEAGIEVMVLVSKADLLDPAALARVREYIRRNLREQLGMDHDVFPISIAPSFAEALETWYADHVLPRIARHEELRQRSIARKVGAVVEAVAATLERLLNREARAGSRHATAGDDALRSAARTFEEVRSAGEEALLAIPQSTPVVIRHAAERIGQDARAQTDAATAEALVRSTLEEAMALAAAPVAAQLKSAIAAAREALVSAEASPDSLDERAFLHELPRPDLGALGLHVKVGAAKWFGAAATRAAIQRAIEEQAGGVIQTAVGTYGALLRRWFLRALEAIRSAFELAADAYRAQRAATGRAASDPRARAALRADLERLRALIEQTDSDGVRSARGA